MALLVRESTSLSFPRFKNISSDRPMMLKDFLRDDYNQYSCTSSSSSSSNGFQMYPGKKSCKSTVYSKSNKQPSGVVLLRSWSKRVNAVKFLQFVKSPLTVLPRSNLMRKFAKDVKKKDVLGDVISDVKVKIKIKDILRWRSFRDMEEDESTPLDYPSFPHRTTITSTSCSKGSSSSCSCSWCDSDFTAEDLPFWGGENEELSSKNCFLGTNATLLRKNTKEDWSIDDSEQQSPVSVLDSPFREVRESISPFHPTLLNFERTKSILTGRLSKGVMNAAEEKAKQLLSHVKEDIQSKQANDHMIILDFFMHELSINGKLHDVEFHNEILRFAKSWINGEYDDESHEWGVKDKREAYVKDIEKGVSWNKFKQEEEEISIEFEVRVLDELIDQVLVDYLTK